MTASLFFVLQPAPLSSPRRTKTSFPRIPYSIQSFQFLINQFSFMDQLQSGSLCRPSSASSAFPPPSSSRSPTSNCDFRPELEAKDPNTMRKVQKTNHEKLRRDRLNEHFFELENTLDPDRLKNDNATILTDTIQILRDLTAEVHKLKAECAAVSEESQEVF